MSFMESNDSRSWKTRLLALLVSISIAIPFPLLAEENPEEPLAENEVAVENVPTPVAERLSNLMALQFQMREEMARIEQEQGVAALREKIDKNRLVIQEANVGTAKATLIGGHAVVRVTPVDSQVTYIFADKANATDVSSSLYNQFIPRQHLFAGTDRTDGIDGRDVVVVWMDGHGADIETHARAKRFSAQHWKEYFQAVAKNPTMGDVLLGQMSGIIQFGLGLAAAGLYQMVNPDTEFLWDPAVMNYIFGSVIGTFHRTYTNIIYPFARMNARNQAISAAKASVVSLAFAVTLMARTNGLDVLNPIPGPGDTTLFHFINISAMGTYAWIASNMFASNYAKNAIRQIIRVREEARVNTRDLKFKLFGRDVYLNQKGIEGQLIAEPGPNIIKNVDLLHLDVGPVPLSKMILFSSVPFFQWISHKYAVKNHPEVAERMGISQSPLIAWARNARRVAKLPITMIQGLRDFSVNAFSEMIQITRDPATRMTLHRDNFMQAILAGQERGRQERQSRIDDSENTRREFESLPRRVESNQLNPICQANFRTAG